MVRWPTVTWAACTTSVMVILPSPLTSPVTTMVTVAELLGLPEIVCSAEKYVYHRRDTEENIRPDAVPQN